MLAQDDSAVVLTSSGLAVVFLRNPKIGYAAEDSFQADPRLDTDRGWPPRGRSITVTGRKLNSPNRCGDARKLVMVLGSGSPNAASLRRSLVCVRGDRAALLEVRGWDGQAGLDHRTMPDAPYPTPK